MKINNKRKLISLNSGDNQKTALKAAYSDGKSC